MRLIHRAGAATLTFLLAGALAPAAATAASPATCTASGSTTHCLSIVNKSAGRILSWRLRVYNPTTFKYEPKNCVYVQSPVTDSAGKKLYYANIHLTEGRKFTLESYLGRRDCGGDMWAGQGWTVGRGDKNNYTNVNFTASNPGGLF